MSEVDDLIDISARASPGHVPGTRTAHAPGICARGWFQGSDVAPSYTTAEQFRRKVPATVRFSDGTGEPRDPCSGPNLTRGMAIKFHLGDGSEEQSTDMVALTLPAFFARDPAEFAEFMRAATPAPVRRRPTWRKVLDQLTIRDAPADPPPDVTLSRAAAVFAFVGRHPSAAGAIVNLGTFPVPESYGTWSYHGIHAFVLTGPDGAKRPVRFDWEPVDGVRVAPKGTCGDVLPAELGERLGRGAVEFVLRMQVGEQGDDTSDPTTAWPPRRRRVVMGRLVLEDLVPQQECEWASFNPTRLVPGIEVSDDPILIIRGPVYKRSSELRRAVTAPS